MINAFRFVTAPPPVQEYVPNSFEFLTIGDPGNVADTTTYGAVDYEFQISKYEVREADINQYNELILPDSLNSYSTKGPTLNGISNLNTSQQNASETHIRISGDGNRFIAGDPSSKIARVYEWSGSAWTQLGPDFGPSPEISDLTGISVDINEDGSRVIFSSPSYDITTIANNGRVQVFEWTGSAWNQLGSDFLGATNDEIGQNVAINSTGNRIAYCVASSNQTFVYEWSGSAWNPIGTITTGSAQRLNFNSAGDRIIIGGNINSTGVVQVYEYAGGSTWNQLGSDFTGNNGSLSKLGRSVDINALGDIIVIGANSYVDTVASDAGSVIAYKWTGTSWSQLGQRMEGAGANDYWGEGLAINAAGTQIAIGTKETRIEVFQWNGFNWINSHTVTEGTLSSWGKRVTCDASGATIISNSGDGSGLQVKENPTLQITLHTTNGDDYAATGVSWNESVRFINWLNARHGYEPAYKFITGGVQDNIALWQSGDNGYDPDNLYRHNRAVYYLPGEDEWYKAAYFDPNKNGPGLSGYWDYATGSDTSPTSVVSGTASDTAVWDLQISDSVAPVESAGGLSPYGTMGQNGNALEWIETAFDGTNTITSENRVMRGGAYTSLVDTTMAAGTRNSSSPGTENNITGLRVAKRNVIIVDDADTAFTATAGFSGYSGNTVISGYNVNFYSAPSGTGSEVATWTFMGLDPGNYEVSITWRERDVFRATNAPFTVFDSTTAISTGYVNMRDLNRPLADHIEGTVNGDEPFEIIFPSVNITSGTLKVELTDDADDFVIADAVRIEPASIQSWTQIGPEVTGAALDAAGWSVDIDYAGDTLAVTAPGSSTGALTGGAVRVYENSGGTWSQIGSDILGTDVGGGLQGTYTSISSGGDIVVVGRPFANNDGTQGRGYVDVYENIAGTWTPIHNTLSGEGSNDRFGQTIDINGAGNIIAVGSGLTESLVGGSDVGAVYIYENTGSDWTQVGSTIYGETSAVNDPDYNVDADYWGWSVALNGAGDKFVSSAYGNDAENYPLSSAVGHVRVFELSAGDWVQVGDDINGDAVGDSFGFAVDMNESGNIIAASSFRSDGTPTESDYVRVFENVGGTWTQIGSDIISDTPGKYFGYSLKLNAAGDTIAIGEFFYDSTGTQAGRVVVYRNFAGNWIQVGPDIDGDVADDRAGRSVSINGAGDIVAVGATRPVSLRNDAGSVRVYSLTPS